MPEMPEPIDVITIFHNHAIRPAKFKYAGRTHVVEKILYTWITREGRYPVHHFSVLTRDGNRFQIDLDTYQMAWSLSPVDEGMPRSGALKSTGSPGILPS